MGLLPDNIRGIVPEIKTPDCCPPEGATTACCIASAALNLETSILTITLENGDVFPIDFTPYNPDGLVVGADLVGTELQLHRERVAPNGTIVPLADVTVDLSGLSGSYTVQRVLYVRENGDDTTAVAYDPSKPWRNPTVALLSAIYGDAIDVEAGYYGINVIGTPAAPNVVVDDGTQRLIKDGVVLRLHEGAVIDFQEETAAASEPLYDDGIAGVYRIEGRGHIQINRGMPYSDKNFTLTNVGSSLLIRAKTLYMSNRIFCTNLNAIDIEVDTCLAFQNGVLVVRPTLATKASVRFKANYLEKGNVYSLNPSFNHFDIRLLTESFVELSAGDYVYKASYGTGNVSLINFQGAVDAPGNVIVIDFPENRNSQDGTLQPYPLMTVTNCYGNIDAQYRGIEHAGICFQVIGSANMSGRILFQGTCYDNNFQRNILAGSIGRLTVDINLRETRTSSTLSNWLVSGAQYRTHLTGRLSTESAQPILGTALGHTTAATLKDLVLAAANAIYCISGTGTPAVNVPILNTYSNVLVDVTNATEQVSLVITDTTYIDA